MSTLKKIILLPLFLGEIILSPPKKPLPLSRELVSRSLSESFGDSLRVDTPSSVQGRQGTPVRGRSSGDFFSQQILWQQLDAFSIFNDIAVEALASPDSEVVYNHSLDGGAAVHLFSAKYRSKDGTYVFYFFDDDDLSKFFYDNFSKTFQDSGVAFCQAMPSGQKHRNKSVIYFSADQMGAFFKFVQERESFSGLDSSFRQASSCSESANSGPSGSSDVLVEEGGRRASDLDVCLTSYNLIQLIGEVKRRNSSFSESCNRRLSSLAGETVCLTSYNLIQLIGEVKRRNSSFSESCNRRLSGLAGETGGVGDFECRRTSPSAISLGCDEWVEKKMESIRSVSRCPFAGGLQPDPFEFLTSGSLSTDTQPLCKGQVDDEKESLECLEALIDLIKKVENIGGNYPKEERLSAWAQLDVIFADENNPGKRSLEDVLFEARLFLRFHEALVSVDIDDLFLEYSRAFSLCASRDSSVVESVSGGGFDITSTAGSGFFYSNVTVSPSTMDNLSAVLKRHKAKKVATAVAATVIVFSLGLLCRNKIKHYGIGFYNYLVEKVLGKRKTYDDDDDSDFFQLG